MEELSSSTNIMCEVEFRAASAAPDAEDEAARMLGMSSGKSRSVVTRYNIRHEKGSMSVGIDGQGKVGDVGTVVSEVSEALK